MSSVARLLALLAFTVLAICLVGCSREPAAAPALSTTTEGPAAENQSEAKTIDAAFAKLSPADRELATKQRICPVSQEPLGTMGAPPKVAVAGHDVFICCEHCKEPLLEDPATHLANIGLKPATETPAQ